MNTTTSNAKYLFLELGILAALYVSVVSFITFSFSVINYLFPDRLAYSFDPYSSSLRFAISTLIVVFPLFVVLSRLMWKMLIDDIPSRALAIRRWLSYLTLFIAGGVVAGDLVTLVNTFLGGEITTRFILKVLVVLVVAAAVFIYSLKNLKGVFFDKPHLFNRTMVSASVVMLLCVVGGLVIVGMPASQRDLRDDQMRSSNLQSMQWEVVNHYQRTGTLPQSASALIDPLYPNNTDFLNDPETGNPYEYRVIASTTPIFELCADFALPSKTEEYKGRGDYPEGFSARYSYVDYYPSYGEAFEHVEGRNCFTRIIDPVRYPIQKPSNGVIEPGIVR
jgi:hypothetical protein